MAGLFNRHIATLLPRIGWRHFGVGALQGYLYEDPRLEQRLHIWHSRLVRPGIAGQGDCHDHRFSFVSQVLCGTIYNEAWRATEHPDGDYDVYTVENARAAKARLGSHDGSCQLVGRYMAAPCSREEIRAGDSYEFPRGVFHRSSAVGLTVTLVTKFDQQETPARILCPHGKPLVHAFGGPVPELEPVLQAAQEALCR
jgi:hypothetical protein